MLAPILGEIREQLALLESAKTDPAYQVFASGRVQGPTGSKKVLWSPEQWWEAFIFVFLCEAFEAGDDLLFFVYAPNHRGRGLLSYFVMRKAQELPKDLWKDGDKFSKVDWCETVVLNLVLQTRYRLDVAVCRESAKMFVNDASADLGEDSIRVSHEVFGSTTKTDLNPNGLVSDPSKSVPEDCFPNVCFAIHDFSEAFDKLVMTEKDQSYVVMLTAFGGALSALEGRTSNPAMSSSNLGSIQPSESEESYVNVLDPASMVDVSPQEECGEPEVISSEQYIETHGNPEGDSSQNAATPVTKKDDDGFVHSESGKPQKVSINGTDCPMDPEMPTAPTTPNNDTQSSCVEDSPPKVSAPSADTYSVRAFAGSVDCEAVRNLAAKEPLKKSRFVKMKGPGGHGLADVVVTCENDELFPPTPTATDRLVAVQKELRTLKPKQILQKGLGLAARAAKGVLVGHPSTFNQMDGMVDFNEVPLRCSLRTLSMPMHVLALRILDASVS